MLRMQHGAWGRCRANAKKMVGKRKKEIPWKTEFGLIEVHLQQDNDHCGMKWSSLALQDSFWLILCFVSSFSAGFASTCTSAKATKHLGRVWVQRAHMCLVAGRDLLKPFLAAEQTLARAAVWKSSLWLAHSLR